jgi:hypothetical protein
VKKLWKPEKADVCSANNCWLSTIVLTFVYDFVGKAISGHVVTAMFTSSHAFAVTTNGTFTARYLPDSYHNKACALLNYWLFCCSSVRPLLCRRGTLTWRDVGLSVIKAHAGWPAKGWCAVLVVHPHRQRPACKFSSNRSWWRQETTVVNRRPPRYPFGSDARLKAINVA